MNYLCQLFRVEMSAAAERVLPSGADQAGAPKLGLSVSAGKIIS